MARALMCQYQYRIHDSFFLLWQKWNGHFPIDMKANDSKKGVFKGSFYIEGIDAWWYEKYHYKYDFFAIPEKEGSC